MSESSWLGLSFLLVLAKDTKVIAPTAADSVEVIFMAHSSSKTLAAVVDGSPN